MSRPAHLPRISSVLRISELQKSQYMLHGSPTPYDPSWEMYFEKCLDVQMEARLKGRRWLSHRWKVQNGRCPICHQKITKSTGWHSHHLLWRSKGGSDSAENRVLLHPTCHQQVHNQGMSVEKPRPVTRAVNLARARMIRMRPHDDGHGARKTIRGCLALNPRQCATPERGETRCGSRIPPAAPADPQDLET